MYNYDDQPATRSDAVRQWASAYGSERPDQAWVLSDYDTWERNPFYQGEPQPHPDDVMWGAENDDTCDRDEDAFLQAQDDLGNCEDDYSGPIWPTEDDDIPF